jgi:hypothetical protein
MWLRVVDLPDDPASRRPPKQKMACAQQSLFQRPWMRLYNRPFSLIPTYSILPLFNFVETGSVTADNLS